MKVAIMSDTHSLLRAEVIDTIKDCDIIMHAGDIASKETHDRLRGIGEAYFVRGNADKEWIGGLYEEEYAAHLPVCAGAGCRPGNAGWMRRQW